MPNVLGDAVSEFAAEYVTNPSYQPKWPDGPKIIHDPLWGTIRLEPWEVAILDLPLIQRLRQIRQTSLASYVFPGCNHSRFEHTLGVVHQAQQLAEAVNGQPARSARFDRQAIRDLRLAALFHDCGHGCFSHLSEDIYQFCDDIRPILDGDGPFSRGNAHEVMGAIILSSSPVREYLEEVQNRYQVKLNVDRAAGWIVGRPEDGDETGRYLTQVINGPFDADKLDYIFRDAHYSGLPLGLDLDRLWACCAVGNRPASDSAGKGRILTLDRGSTTPLEQILFNKVNLFAVVYQHPKIRAVEAMFQGVVEHVVEAGETVEGRSLRSASDYLWVTDDRFFAAALSAGKGLLHEMIHRILYRRHFVRALTISSDTANTERYSEQYQQLRKLNQRHERKAFEARRQLSEEIWRTSNAACSKHEIWLDLPPDPPTGEPDRTFVRMPGGGLVKMSNVFPMNYWVQFYMAHKWRGHVFCPPEHQAAVSDAAIDVLEGTYGLRFSSLATKLSHVK